jgi:hypothetical protein
VERARQFYRDRVMLNPADDVALLVEQGLLRRIDGPARLLDSLAPT